MTRLPWAGLGLLRHGGSVVVNGSLDEEQSASVLDPESIERLLRRLEATDIDELEIVEGDARIYLRREPGHRSMSMASSVSDAPEQDPAAVITAPLTGVYYGRPSPEQPAFVEAGQHVEPGQVVALIETMKLFNEVTAEIAGEVTRVAVDDGDLVEAGQALVYIQPAETSDVA